MSSSWARHRVVLVALAGLAAAGGLVTPGRTAAVFTATASTAGGVVTTPRACVGGPAGYTSGLLDDAAPLLRWSFSGAAPAPAATPEPVGPGGPPGTATGGLLECDPLDLAAEGDAGPTAVRALDLAGEVGGGLTSAPVLPSGPSSLLMWVQVGAGDGELASLSVPRTAGVAGTEAGAPAAAPTDPSEDAGPVGPAVPDGGTAPPPGVGPDAAPGEPAHLGGPVPGDGTDPDVAGSPSADQPDALVLDVAGDSVRLTGVHGGGSTPLASTTLTPGAAHLVLAVVGTAGDGTPQVTLAVDGAPASAPVPLPMDLTGAALTVGARPAATAAVARVDEVTVLPGELSDGTRDGLVAADRWWSTSGRAPAPATAG